MSPMIPLRTTMVPMAIALAALVASAPARAQIYTCTAADGSKVFSDEKCGPDAKKVTLSPPQVASARPAPAKAQPKSLPPAEKPQTAQQKAGLKPPTTTAAPTKKPVATPKQPWELEALLASCNEGNMKACSEWTHGGGTKLLREKEQQAQAQCASGSLAACEE